MISVQTLTVVLILIYIGFSAKIIAKTNTIGSCIVASGLLMCGGRSVIPIAQVIAYQICSI